jgi:chromatin segregation and condensation protein Rec8/ScpA/Scc1 (kleisin family)
VGYADLPGGRVMAEREQKDKAEEEKTTDFKKTTEYRRFKKLLKRVVKAPPFRRNKISPSE